MLLPAVRGAPGDTLILADGFSCKEQIEQGTGRRALHLAEFNAMTANLDLMIQSPKEFNNTILVPATLAFGFLMNSLKVASSQVRPEFLFASE